MQKLLAPALLAILLTACQSGPDFQPGLTTPPPVEGLGQDLPSMRDAGGFVLRPADVISVTVYREENLSLERTPVGPSGEVSFPLLGSMAVAGMTAAELEARLEDRYEARFLRNAEVSVNVIELGSHIVTVTGQVAQPGIYSFQPGTRLSGSIALASGGTRVADTSNVAIFRETPEGLMVAKFDYNQVLAGTMLDPIMVPGDRVVVGTSGLSQLWQDALRAIPVFALFTRI